MKRDPSLDFIRGVAIVLIVFSHVLQRGILDYETQPISTLLFLFAMPAFFFVSGINMARRGPLKPLGFFIDVLRRGIAYLWPAILFLLLRTYIYGQWLDFPQAWSAFMDNAQVGLWVLWALALINGVLDVGLLVSSITRKHPKIHGAIWILLGYVTLIILRFNHVLLSDSFIGYDTLLLFMPVTLVGYLLGDKFLKLCKGYFNFPWMVLGFTVTLIFGLFVVPYYESPIENRQFIVYFGSSFAVMFYGGLSGLLAKYGWTKMLRTSGRYSLEIYLLHLLLVKAWPNLMLEEGFLTGLRIAATTLGLLAFSEAIIKVTNSVPFLHLLAFGRAGDNAYDQKAECVIKDFCLTH